MSSTPRVIVPDRLLEPGDRHSIGEPIRHHLIDVLRLRTGDEVLVVDRDGRAFRARLGGTGGERVLEVIAPEPQARAARQRVRIRLLLGLLKSDRTEWAIQKATEVGVGEVRVVVCERSVPRPALSEAGRRLSRLRRVAAEAARQCGRAEIPDVTWHPDLASAIESVVAGSDATPAGGGRRLWLDESPDVRPLVASLSARPSDDVSLAVGPEGAFSPSEREVLLGAGFEPAGLGPRVLRAETAAVVAVTVVQVVLGDLSGKSVPKGG